MVNIGEKIRRYRQKLGLTQEELAARTELSKGFISQLERDLTSPSIATLTDILEALGTNLSEFFTEARTEKIVFTSEDMFEKEETEAGYVVRWLVPNAQKNCLEPIMITLEPGGSTYEENPHEGEEFGFVLHGNVVLHIGEEKYRVRKGDSFSFKPSHLLQFVFLRSTKRRVSPQLLTLIWSLLFSLLARHGLDQLCRHSIPA